MGRISRVEDVDTYVRRPQVVETEDRVYVTLSSETFEGAATCPGNPHVPITLHLDEPIGDRELAGDWAVQVSAVDRDLARRILDSVEREP